MRSPGWAAEGVATGRAALAAAVLVRVAAAEELGRAATEAAALPFSTSGAVDGGRARSGAAERGPATVSSEVFARLAPVLLEPLVAAPFDRERLPEPAPLGSLRSLRAVPCKGGKRRAVAPALPRRSGAGALAELVGLLELGATPKTRRAATLLAEVPATARPLPADLADVNGKPRFR